MPAWALPLYLSRCGEAQTEEQHGQRQSPHHQGPLYKKLSVLQTRLTPWSPSLALLFFIFYHHPCHCHRFIFFHVCLCPCVFPQNYHILILPNHQQMTIYIPCLLSNILSSCHKSYSSPSSSSSTAGSSSLPVSSSLLHGHSNLTAGHSSKRLCPPPLCPEYFLTAESWSHVWSGCAFIKTFFLFVPSALNFTLCQST